MERKSDKINDKNAIDNFNLSIDVVSVDDANKRRVQNPMESSMKLETLPYPLIHDIMECLSTKDATKFSILSKTFNSTWLLFPVLDFDNAWFSDQPPETFFSFVQRTLQHRGPHLEGRLRKLRFCYETEFQIRPYNFDPILEDLINFALQNHAKEIDFDINITLNTAKLLDIPYYVVDVSYNSIHRVFSSKLLTVVKLRGLKIPIKDSVITCHSLKFLSINSCGGFTTVKVSCPRLQEVEFIMCSELQGIRVESEILESFKFIGFRDSSVRACEFDLSTCQHMKNLTLENTKVSEEFLNQVPMSLVEFLHVSHCVMPKNLKIDNPNIRILEMNKCKVVERLFVSAPNLESLEYQVSNFRQNGTIDISECIILKKLILKRVNVTERWVKRTISALNFLEMLQLNGCNLLEKIDFKNDNLKMFTLISCNKLKEATIDAPNLIQFTYSGSLEVDPMVVLSTKCSASVVLHQKNQEQWFEKMRRFLRCFGHFKALTIICASGKDLIFPSEFMWTNLSLLYDLKHLTVEVKELPSSRSVMQVVDSMLWLVPKPDTLTISCGDIKNTLKFEYYNEVQKEVEEICCSEVPIKCWRHYATKIEMEGFDAMSRENLEGFFARSVVKN